MPLKPVILNNTPLVALHLLGQWSLLHQLYGKVLIPTAVEREFLAVARNERKQALHTAPWLHTTPTSLHPLLKHTKLDEGESAVLSLALQQDARLVIIDEQRGRVVAKKLGLSFTGTLGVLLAGKRKGFIPVIAPLLHQLQAEGIYLDPKLVASVQQMAGE
jgi:uncharacterized protein